MFRLDFCGGPLDGAAMPAAVPVDKLLVLSDAGVPHLYECDATAVAGDLVVHRLVPTALPDEYAAELYETLRRAGVVPAQPAAGG